MKQNIDQLYQKFVNNTLTKKEYKILMNFIENPNSQKDVEKMMDNHWDKLASVEKGFKERKNSEGEMLYHKILYKIENGNKTQKGHSLEIKLSRKDFYKVVAVFVFAAGLLYGYQKDILNGSNPWEPSSHQVTSENITLTLDDGKIKVISENGQSKIQGSNGKLIGVQNGSKLNYQESPVSEQIVYNHLSVPYGKRFEIILSDGSQIKLNSGSSLKYPVKFLRGKDRQVFLEGEAYFDIAEDKAHPFIVNANDINVEVLGTQFNMSYYPEDDDISTVLVKGSIELHNKYSSNSYEDSILLTPGHLAAWNKTTREMSIQKVDTEIYTAWTDGTLLFKNTSFKNIRTKLERHFNISIENRYPFLESQVYTASFTHENLPEIMEAFKEDTKFEYELINNKIVITNQPTKSIEPMRK